MLWACLKMVPPICVRKPGKIWENEATSRGLPPWIHQFCRDSSTHPAQKPRSSHHRCHRQLQWICFWKFEILGKPAEDGKELWSPLCWFFYWEKNTNICGNMYQEPQCSTNLLQFYFFIFVYNPMPPHCRNFQWIGDVSWWNVGLTASFKRWHCSCAINVIVCHCQSSLNQS